MPKYLIEESTLEGLANAIRTVAGTDRTYTPTEMIEAVTTILENGAYILVDENGTEIPAVFVSNDEVFTATANDIRIGKTAVTEDGVTEGTKEIPAYITAEGYRLVTAGSEFTLPHEYYDYTKLQVLFCEFNTDLTDSVATDKVAIENFVYDVSSTVALSIVTKDHDVGRILFGITNESSKSFLIRYFMYKEVY